MKGLWRITLFGIFFTILVLIWIFIIGLSSNQAGSFYNKGHNAIWISHKWVGEEKTDQEIQKMIFDLKKNQIDTVYVHAGPLKTDGTIDSDTYAYALAFLEKAKKFDDDIKYYAWLGQLRMKIDLSDEKIRHNIANQTLIMTEMIGFDGIHFDIEPIWDEDINFIQLLKEVDEILAKDVPISVAMAELIPGSFIWTMENIFKFYNYNTEKNFLNVAKYAEQIVVMVYDTSINQEWIYKWLVKEQTIRTTALLDNTEVYIAIPLYGEKTEHFNPEVENVKNGLKGITDGLNDIRSNVGNFRGVALYPYWKIEKDEWDIYYNLWIK